MLYYVFRYVKETKEKNDALREIRRNDWRCPYFGSVRKRRIWQ